MTKARKKSGLPYSVGERGRNRVRAFAHHETGRMFLEYYEPTTGPRQRPKVVRKALEHSDPQRAKVAAEELSAALGRRERPTEHLTLAVLFDNYVRTKTPEKGDSKQRHDRACIEMFQRAFKADREVRSLSLSDWDSFVRERRAGRLRPGATKPGRIVRNRVIAYDLRFLLAAINWATSTRDSRGRILLERNPLKGLTLPREQSPRRPAVTGAEYERLLAVAVEVHPLFRLALVLARETGHRIGAIRQLRWSDVNLESGRIVWRGEADKIGMEHETILSDGAISELRSARAEQAAIGDARMFADSERVGGMVSRHQLRKWWERAAKLADLPSGQRVGWHALRRQFATELKAFPLKDLAALGGWKDTRTLLDCYIKPDEDTMRAMLASRARVG